MSPAGAQAAPTSRVGADLRTARDRLGWSLPEVAAGLRIRLPYLEALEAGNFHGLPGTAYAVGFLRAYAQALGLDPDEMIRRFRAEAGDATRKPELDFPVPVPERGIPTGAIVFLGVVLAIGAYAGWYRLSGQGVLPPEVVPPVPERLAPLAEQAVPPSAPIVVVAPPPAPGAAADTASVAPPPPALATVPANAAAAMTPPPVTVPPAAADDGRILVRAKADAWILVRDKTGQVLFNRTMHAGDTWQVPARPAVLLTTGNAGGTELLVDGVLAPPLGQPGAVRRDLVLDPDQAKNGKLVSAATPVGAPSAAVPPASGAQPSPASQALPVKPAQ